MMEVLTTRFGKLNISEELIVEMKKPILGFEQLVYYVIVETDNIGPFKWLQSVEAPDVAFVLVNPVSFVPDYLIEVHPKEIEELGVGDPNDVLTYCIVTVGQDYSKITANLQGPLLINSKTNLGKQLVLVNSRYRIRHRLFEMPRKEKQKKLTPAQAC